MIPHERSLVQRLENKPFELVGIDSDPKPAYRSGIRKAGITWTSWWDGGTTSGPIATQWNVHSWPTIYLLDAKGVIRYRDVPEESLDADIDALLKEAEGAPAAH